MRLRWSRGTKVIMNRLELRKKIIKETSILVVMLIS
jgi:hypothetical protein